ncbi:MAG: hypothetical protein WBG39_03785 [Gordonia sp. (in: high G+C Gram-positive bacteria)]
MIDPQVHVTSLRRKSRLYLVAGILTGFVGFLSVMGTLANPVPVASGGIAYLAGRLVAMFVMIGIPIIASILCFQRRKKVLADLATVEAGIR